MKWSVLVAVVAFGLFGCSRVSVNPGEKGVLISKPMLFGSGGIIGEITQGSEWVAPTTEMWTVNTKPVQYELELSDIMSKDGVPLDFHAVARMQVTDATVLVREFGVDWYKNNVEMAFAALIREQVKQYGMNETAIDVSAITKIDTAVRTGLDAYLKNKRIPIQLIDITVGRANPPDAVKSQRIETAAQEQRVNTEHQRKLAEDSRKEAEISKAAADNAYRNAMGLNPAQFIQLEQVKAIRDVCAGGKCILTMGITPAIAVTPTN